MKADALAIQAERRILLLRSQRVMLDYDLAELYAVETRALKQAFRRNRDRFRQDFMFELTLEEAEILRSQIVTPSAHGGRRYAPMAFTEQGVAMLSSVLRAKRAVQVNTSPSCARSCACGSCFPATLTWPGSSRRWSANTILNSKWSSTPSAS